MTDAEHQAENGFDFDLAVVRFVDGSIEPQMLEELNAALRADPALRAAFARRCSLVAELHERHTPQEASVPDAAAPVSQSTRPVSTPSGWMPVTIAIAAALLMTAGAVGIYLLVSNAFGLAVQPDHFRARVATLIDADTDVVIDDDLGQAGADYAAGTWSIQTGAAEFQMTSGANVRLRGDTRVVIDDPMNAALTRGTLRIVCPPSAHGYTVRLPNGARVVDLGTVFTVSVDADGRAGVWVLDGSVAIEDADGGRNVIGADRFVAIDAGGIASTVQPQRRVQVALPATGVGLEPGATDPRWSIRRADESDASPAAVLRYLDNAYIRPGDSDARWISVNHPNGYAASDATYVFETTVDLGPLEPETTVIAGRLAVDNRIRAIRVNGQPVEVTGDPLDGFHRWAAIRFADGLVAGSNRIEIEVFNDADVVPTTPLALMLEWSATGVPLVIESE